MKLYNPFQNFQFDDQHCFLTGAPVENAQHIAHAIPDWLMNQFDLRFKPIQMLDERITEYGKLTLPCSPETFSAIANLEEKVKNAIEGGYAAVSQLDEKELFQWISKWVYGMIFNEIQAGIQQQQLVGEAMNFSQVLMQKFKQLHVMLQSLVNPVEFEGHSPFSIHVFPVDNPAETFSYRDEINTLVFSLRMKDFGIIACLQDNGTNRIYHDEVLEKVAGHVLHPIQFEELCARFFYSAYLFNRLPEYSIMELPDRVYIEPQSLGDPHLRPFFDHWQVKTYGQVLENFWKPWGLLLFEIIKDPEHPMSFILDEDGLFNSKISGK
jgi:hypothetical protein